MSDATHFAGEFEECAADAALYVLGALPPEESRAFELRLKGGCPYCGAQAGTFASVVEHLSLSVNPAEPRPDLRQRLLERVQPRGKPSAPSEHMTIVRSGDAPWVSMPFPGVEIRQLIGDKTLMVRMQPGAVFPQHDHPRAEQCYVLEGSITDSDGLTLQAGDFVLMSGGITHAPLHSEEGCVLLVAYTE